LKTGEDLCGPYEWGRYDLLVLPPSFPYGGMENPCLTFVTPTLLAGDRSLANVVAHEIAHSWTGNLVTNAGWADFWLNEGFTVFVERKIVGRLSGQAEADFHAILGFHALEECVAHFGPTNPLTALMPSMEGIDPDDSFSSVPYEKGFNFLCYLQGLVGGPSAFEPYLKAHVQHFAFRSITTADWKAFLLDFFAKRGLAERLSVVDWDTWLSSPGLPPVKNIFDTELADECDRAASSVLKDPSLTQAGTRDLVNSLKASQKVVFLHRLEASGSGAAAALPAMDAAFGFGAAQNAEIRFAWLTLCVRLDYAPAFPAAVAFLTSQGRMKFVRPLFRDLHACPSGKELALNTFRTHAMSYHNIAAALVAKDLSLAFPSLQPLAPKA